MPFGFFFFFGLIVVKPSVFHERDFQRFSKIFKERDKYEDPASFVGVFIMTSGYVLIQTFVGLSQDISIFSKTFIFFL